MARFTGKFCAAMSRRTLSLSVPPWASIALEVGDHLRPRLVDEVRGGEHHLVQLVELESLLLVVLRLGREVLQAVPFRLLELQDHERLPDEPVGYVVLEMVTDLLDDPEDVGILDIHATVLFEEG